ncbi:MAG: hypothetical protein AAF589_09510 [Planctomycetota bacterium]
MRRFVIAVLLPALVIASAWNSAAEAIPPDRIGSYTLVPRLSTLTESDGSGGFTQEYHLRGKYDFLQQWGGGTATDPLGLTARFDNADIRAPLGEWLPAFIDVDELLNLEGLRGELLQLGAPFDVYRFEGTINDNLATSPHERGSTIELYATLIGPWMYLKGFTTPPSTGVNFVEYELSAVARTGVWADMNGDGVVNASDYAKWRNDLADGTPSDMSLGDFRAQYGEAAPDLAYLDALATFSAAAATAAPEPTTLALLAVAALPLRRRR